MQQISTIPQYNFDEFPYVNSDCSTSSESFSSYTSSESNEIITKESSTDLFFTETLKALATDSSHSSNDEISENGFESRNSMITFMKSKQLQVKNGLTSVQQKEYTSDPSVFAIELYGLRDDFDKRLAVDMLEAAFETFPDCEYCIISLPSDVREFPLLHQFTVQ